MTSPYYRAARRARKGKSPSLSVLRSVRYRVMDEVWTDDNFESGSEKEGDSLFSEDDVGSSDPEASTLTRVKDDEKKRTNRFSLFPTSKKTSGSGSHPTYRVYSWRWLMLITMFLLNVSNGTVGQWSQQVVYLSLHNYPCWRGRGFVLIFVAGVQVNTV